MPDMLMIVGMFSAFCGGLSVGMWFALALLPEGR